MIEQAQEVHQTIKGKQDIRLHELLTTSKAATTIDAIRQFARYITEVWLKGRTPGGHDICQAIKEIRAMLGEVQRTFSKRIGITQTTLSLCESGKTSPTQETLEKVSDALGISVSFLKLAAVNPESDIQHQERTLFKQLFPDFSNRIKHIIARPGEIPEHSPSKKGRPR